ncbi:helix-turn-helix transcriptional regulator [Fusobacterium polymorphum]|uniref:helix-turn-helix domain-containing protein n=1 Tax=Fusobacterium nucleatum subsp. polymorphum TaxID=76857 RepID=UPI0030CB02B3
MENIGNFIKNKRKELNLTLKDIADKLEISESLISRYESGNVKKIGMDKLIPLSEILQIDINELLNNINFSRKKKKVTLKEIEIAKRLKKLRTENNLSLRKVADFLNITSSTVLKYENANITNIPIDNITELAKIYKVTPSHILGLDDYDENKIHLSKEEKELILNLRKEKENKEKLFRDLCERFPDLIDELEYTLNNLNQIIENDENKKEEFYYNYNKQLFEDLIKIFQEED